MDTLELQPPLKAVVIETPRWEPSRLTRSFTKPSAPPNLASYDAESTTPNPAAR